MDSPAQIKKVMKLRVLLLCILSATAGFSVAEPQKKSKPVAPEQSKLIVLGQIETATLDEEKISLLARIDTGAETSSLNAQKIEHYERDGKKWVRFEIPSPNKKKPIVVERKLARTVEIKRHGVAPTHRPVVYMTITIGEIHCRCEFSLTDRSKFEFPILIGRNFLSGRALVDVSLKHAAHPINKNQ
jgi:hypothetical protein